MSEYRFENMSNCCTTKSMCGTSLSQGVFIIGWSSVVISSLMLVMSVSYLYMNKNRELMDPVKGIMTLCSMTTVCLSSYQIVISVLMLWQRMQKKPKPFIYSVWYVSHLSLITIYCVMVIAMVAVTGSHGQFAWSILHFLHGIIYIAMLIYFEIVINSYLNSGNVGDRYI